MRSQNAPNRVLKAAHKAPYWGHRRCRYPKRHQKISACCAHSIVPPTIVASLLLMTMAPFPNQNLKYAIDFDALPSLGGAPIEIMAPNQNPKYACLCCSCLPCYCLFHECLNTCKFFIGFLKQL